MSTKVIIVSSPLPSSASAAPAGRPREYASDTSRNSVCASLHCRRSPAQSIAAASPSSSPHFFIGGVSFTLVSDDFVQNETIPAALRAAAPASEGTSGAAGAGAGAGAGAAGTGAGAGAGSSAVGGVGGPREASARFSSTSLVRTSSSSVEAGRSPEKSAADARTTGTSPLETADTVALDVRILPDSERFISPPRKPISPLSSRTSSSAAAGAASASSATRAASSDGASAAAAASAFAASAFSIASRSAGSSCTPERRWKRWTRASSSIDGFRPLGEPTAGAVVALPWSKVNASPSASTTGGAAPPPPSSVGGV